MLIDAHLHCTGREDADSVLHTLDEAGVDHAVLLAPLFAADGPAWRLADARAMAKGNRHLAALVRGHADRLTGFAVLDPAAPSAVDDLERAVAAGLAGVKMVPSGWEPHDDAVQPLFATASALGLPLLFHSGIFIDGRSSRHCRPAGFEPLREHAGCRVALAHLGWPWTDEAIALGLIDLIHGKAPRDCTFRFDLSFGAPPPYRHGLLQRALAVLGPGLLQWGSDCFLPCRGADITARRRELLDAMDAVGVDRAAREAIDWRTAADWLRWPAGHPPQCAGGPLGRAPTGAATPPAAPAARHAPLRRQGWLGARGRLAPTCC